MQLERWLTSALSSALLVAGPAFAQGASDPGERESTIEQGSTSSAPSTGAEPSAQTCPPCPSATWGSSRVLAGHRFIYPTFVETGFVSTYAGTRTGASQTTIPNLPFGRLGEVDLEDLRLAEAIDLGVKIVEQVGLFATFNAIGTAGTNPRTVLIRTGQYDLNGRGGALVRLLDGESYLLSVRAYGGGGGGKGFALASLIGSLIDTPVATLEDVVTGKLDELTVVPFSRWEVGGSLMFAKAFSSAFSLQAALDLAGAGTELRPFDAVLDRRRDIDFASLSSSLGAALTGDARTVGVPLALTLEYRFSRTSINNHDTNRSQLLFQNVVAAGLYYSGRQDLQLGLLGFANLGLQSVTGFTASGEPADSDEPRILGGTLTVRYVW